MRLLMFRFHREIRPDEFKAVMNEHQQAGLTLLITSANRAYFGALGLDHTAALSSSGALLGDTPRYIDGDLIPTEAWDEVVYIGLRRELSHGKRGRPRQKHFLDLGSISNAGLGQFSDTVKSKIVQALGETETPKTWLSRMWTNPRFDELVAQGTFLKGTCSTEEKLAADELRSREIWKLAVAVKAAGSMLIKDVERVGGTQDGNTRLQAVGLLKKEQVLICKKTSSLLNRLSSSESLKELDDRGISCGSCGRKLSDELLAELLVPTELAKNLLDHSRWMAVILLDCLRNLGIQADRTLLEFHEGGEEVDAFVDVDGALVLVELKDKEFSMGHAYPLPGRIAIYHPDQVLIVTTEKVAPEVRDYFDRIKPETHLSYVEGLDALQSALDGVVNFSRGKKMRSLLQRYNPLTIGVDIAVLIATKLDVKLPEKEREDNWKSMSSRFFV